MSGSSLLVINSSPLAERSSSRALVRHYVSRWQASNPAGRVVERDASANAIPHIDGALIGAFFTPPEAQTASHRDRTALSDALIAELEAADELVFGVAMHNFGVPSSLKAYIDHVVRAGHTFRNTAAGPEGLLRDRKATIIVTSGNRYDAGPLADCNHANTWLTSILGFLGIRSVASVCAGGLAFGDEARSAALAAAEQALDARVAA